jgi:hypothetical protein
MNLTVLYTLGEFTVPLRSYAAPVDLRNSSVKRDNRTCLQRAEKWIKGEIETSNDAPIQKEESTSAGLH